MLYSASSVGGWLRGLFRVALKPRHCGASAMAGLAVHQARRSDSVESAVTGNFIRDASEAARAGIVELALLRGSGRRLELWCIGLAQPSLMEKELECTLNAHTSAIVPVRRNPTAPSTQPDAIALLSGSNRVAVLEYDPHTFSLRASSLHLCHAADALASNNAPGQSQIAADPDGRAVALLFNGGHDLAIIPAVETGHAMAEVLPSVTSGAASPLSSSARMPAAGLQSSYTVSLHRDLGLGYGVDIAFLHGYAEPTVVVLHERRPTWASTAAFARDTKAVTALSVNTSAKKHPAIWSCDRLPFECYTLCAAPLPLGGVLIVAPNMLLHRSQSSRYTLATAANALGGKEPDLDEEFADTQHHHFHHKEQIASGISNPPPAVAEHAEQSEQDAELFGCCPAFVDPSCCFLPCRDGVVYTVMLSKGVRGVGRMSLQKSSIGTVQTPTCSEAIAQRLVFSGSTLGRSSLVHAQPVVHHRDANDPGSHEKHMKQQQDKNGGELTPVTGRKRKRPSAVASDDQLVEVAALSNIGPISDAGTRELDSFKPEGVASPIPSSKELVAAAGCGSDGAVAFMRRRVEVDVLIGVELAGVKAVHALLHRPGASSSTKRSDYLIICKEQSTMVLEAQEELQELTSERTDLILSERTVGCGTLFGGARIAQATPSGIRLAAGTVWAQDVSLEAIGANPDTDHIASVHFNDPDALVVLSDGSLRFLEGDTDLHKMARNKAAESVLPGEKATAACLAHDESCFFGKGRGHVAAIALQSGRLMLVSFGVSNSGKKLLLSAPGLSDGEHVLAPDGGGRLQGGQDENRRGPQPPKIVEMRLDTFQSGLFSRPLLTAVRRDGEVLLYKGFKQSKLLRFSRITSEWCNGGVDTGGFALARMQGVRADGPIHGVLVAGERPLLAVAWQGCLYLHPMRCTEPTVCASQFDNANCPQGLVIATARDLQFAQLAKGFELAQPWPTRRFWMEGTPTRIATPAALSSGEGPITVSVKRLRAHRDRVVRDEHDSHGRIAFAAARAAAGRRKGFEDSEEIRALDSHTGSITWREELEPGERCLSLRALEVLNVTTSQNEELYVVGTAYYAPEDVPCKGRHLVFKSERKRSKKGSKKRHFGMNKVVAKQSTGACSAIAAMDGYMLVCAGPKLTVQCWTGTDLRQLAFYDTPLHVTALSVVKNFALVADVHKGIRFVQWRAQDQLLEPLSKLYAEMSCMSAEFALEHGSLALLCTDVVGTMHRLEYKRNSAASWRGQKLLPVSSTSLQTRASLMIRMGMLEPSSGEQSPTRQAATVLGADGSITYAVPVPEQTGSFMSRLEHAVARRHPQQPSCLNPKELRQPLSERGKPEAVPPRAEVIDCDVLGTMLDLSLSAQANCAAAASGSLGEAHAALSKMYASTDWF